ncbi:hypothetical protein QJS10_CPA01g02682 [Acorus calamus]|uniref:Ubiquitin-like domain-containing protein n=1 Tax=Acorus calamus TaxID=4465 RepID=A0AAV9FJW1_ACOCL|nr:hypothetical protein QJS10_CPA01g02682 [Acorus calamus]
MITVTVTNRTWTNWPVETLTGEFPSVGELKREVHRVCRVVSDLQLLVHDGKLMHDDVSHPSLYGVVDGTSIDLHVQVPPYKNVTLTVQYLGNPFPMARWPSTAATRSST